MDGGEAALPLIVSRNRPDALPAPRSRRRRRLLVIPVAMALLLTGGVVGLYFQPPGLQLLFRTTGLTPGGGTSSPIAVPLAVPPAGVRASGPGAAPAAAAPPLVVALGRLIPEGDVTTVAPPYGAGDARIAELRARRGDRVRRGDVLAVLDNLAELESAVASAEAAVLVREASLAQTRDAVRASFEEAEATVRRAEAAAEEARAELARARSLLERGVTTQAVFDTARSEARQAEREVERSRAVLSRYQSEDLDRQPDVVVAGRNLDAARADLVRAERDLEKAYVRAPLDATVLDVHVRAGEKPGEEGVMDLGDTERMTAELEVHQTQIAAVSLGDPVEITGDAFADPLQGRVVEIGLDVERQTLTGDDPAANTDARVVEVTVALDPASSTTASRFTNLQVTGRIATGDPR